MKRKAVLDTATLFALSAGDLPTLKLLEMLFEADFEVLACATQVRAIGHMSKGGNHVDKPLAERLIDKMIATYGIRLAEPPAANRSSTLSRMLFSYGQDPNPPNLSDLEAFEDAREAKADVLITYRSRLRGGSGNHPGLPFKHGAFSDPWCCTVTEMIAALKLATLVRP